MEKPPIPNASPSSKPAPKSNPKRKIPSPKELISHYESQGMDAQEASIKVIEDLQRALFGVISSGRGKKDKLLIDSSRKMDAVNGRLAVLDMKLDSKPGYVETFAIGVASAATLRGIGAIMPHIIAPIAQIWNSVTTATKSTPQ
ncbi:uncharacterized protein LOC107462752 [Arachis duranensis]|uniref:Uncharacterized protein LOC107462752 n=1 Tax=Arachis duranensis TaxID=130453 RepID=A0A6P4BXI4_ARADU|nr:uncharacterized protein LOC107462752 [Arachis duranensis]XP_015936874.1 uncharacterized protein LOC107462752 [Arachis duranensis]XP_015936875.1 uncharacterized protein LOC107462752 [Arachis duranensis]